MKKHILELGEDCNMIVGKVDRTVKLYGDNSPIGFIKPCLGLRINIHPDSEDEHEAILIYLDTAQAKGMIKGIRAAMRGL